MFDDSESAAIEYVFESDTVTPIASELRATGGTVSDGSCPDCGGVVYDHEHEVVCGHCSLVISSNADRPDAPSKWEYFWANRPRYRNSRKRRCVGGFASAHDWLTSDEIEGTVSDVDPETFYQHD